MQTECTNDSDDQDGDEFEDILEVLTLSQDGLNTGTMENQNETVFNEKDLKDQERIRKENIDQQPLYLGASITIGAVMVLLSLYVVKFNLPADAISRLLTILNLILPSGHVLPTTLNRFKLYFTKLKSPLILHYYCSFCLASEDAKGTTCSNPACLKDLTVRGSRSYFVEFPIVHQLQTFFNRPSFYQDIQDRFKRKKKEP